MPPFAPEYANGAAERVAAVARDDVEDGAGGFGLAQAAGRVVTISCEPATFETAAFELAPAHPVLMPSCRVRESDGRAPWMLSRHHRFRR